MIRKWMTTRWPSVQQALSFAPLLLILFAGMAGCNVLEMPTANYQTRAHTVDGRALLMGDDFEDGMLHPLRWRTFSVGDFNTVIADVVPAPGADSPADHRLRLHADTIRAVQVPAKSVGVRFEPLIQFGDGKRIEIELDWNNGGGLGNGSYLAAGLMFVPHIDGRPAQQDHWLKIRYIGVPPRDRARLLIETRKKGSDTVLFNEDWPKQNRTGRAIGKQQLVLHLSATSLRLNENGRTVFETDNHNLGFDRGYLCLLLDTHSNYPPREVYFDNLRVMSAPAPESRTSVGSPSGVKISEGDTLIMKDSSGESL